MIDFTAYIWDAAALAVILFFVIFSAKRGFVRASKSILALILTAVLLTSLQPTVQSYLEGSALGENVRTAVAGSLTESFRREQLPEDTDTTDTDTSVMICKNLALPQFMADSLEDTVKQMSEVKNNVLEVIADGISETILRVLSVILLFLAVRLFVFLILKILESLFELPGLRTVNRTLGAIVGIVNALLAVYIICGAVSLFTPVDKLPAVDEAISSTYFLKYFYENNLLLSLFV